MQGSHWLAETAPATFQLPPCGAIQANQLYDGFGFKQIALLAIVSQLLLSIDHLLKVCFPGTISFRAKLDCIFVGGDRLLDCLPLRQKAPMVNHGIFFVGRQSSSIHHKLEMLKAGTNSRVFILFLKIS